MAALLLLIGLGVLLAAVLEPILFGAAPMLVGSQIQALGAEPTGAANLVTAVLLGYRGFDTLGELTILFAAATGAGMVLAQGNRGRHDVAPVGFVLQVGSSLIFPLLLLFGFYTILHGHITPGGGFQGGAILAAAYFVPLLGHAGHPLPSGLTTLLEGLAGITFIVVGLVAMMAGDTFLTPFGDHGTLGQLLSAGSLPLLSIAIGVKVGTELANVLAHLGGIEQERG